MIVIILHYSEFVKHMGKEKIRLKMKDSGIEWIDEILNDWSITYGQY